MSVGVWGVMGVGVGEYGCGESEDIGEYLNEWSWVWMTVGVCVSMDL